MLVPFTVTGTDANHSQFSLLVTLKKLLLFFFKIFFTLLCLALFSTFVSIVYLFVTLPSPTQSLMHSAPLSTYILDRHGEVLYEVHGEVKRTPIPLTTIPLYARQATIAIEDKDFYHHFGFKPSSIVRAILVNLRHGEIRQGASTITQQMARIALLDNRQTYTRKIKELILAIKIEMRYSKDEILEMYLNNVPYGSNAYGIEAASEIYFGKHAQELTLKEATYIAALPKAPTTYSPYGPHSDALHARSLDVVLAMYELGFISSDVRDEVLREEKKTFTRPPTHIKAPHFVFYVIDQLVQMYGQETVQNGGMRVQTSLDLSLQQKAEQIVATHGEKNEKQYRAVNAALVALDPRSGEILSMVGSRDYFSPKDGAVNVTIEPRQPGSSFKPYVYATAFTKGMSPATMILDVETNFANDNYGVPYVPHNYTGRNYGPVSIRQALAGSLNVPAVKVLILSGIQNSLTTAERLGLTTLKDRKRFGPALVLGGAEVKLLEHTAGLGAFGVGGVKQPLSPILKITNTKGEIIYEKKENTGTQAVDPEVAYLITNILSDTNARQFIFGRGLNLKLDDRPVAVKTGTTQNFRDAWTVGFTPSLAVGVWVGNNDNTPMKDGADGSVVAAPIWKEFTIAALDGQPVEEFKRPEGITEVVVDSMSGKLPTRFTPTTKKELFASFSVPTTTDDIHILSGTPGAYTTILRLRSEKINDPLWEGAVRRWIGFFRLQK